MHCHPDPPSVFHQQIHENQVEITQWVRSAMDYIDRRSRPGSDVGEGIWVSPEDLPKIWDDLHEDTQKLLNLAKVV